MLLAMLPSTSVQLGVLLGLVPVAPPTADAGVALTLHDVNHQETVQVVVALDGSTSPEDRATLERVLRCKRTERQHEIDPVTLGMLAAVGTRYPGQTIELVSGYRAAAKESRTSKHRAGSAIDFRIPGVSTVELRDFVWREYRGVGVGWYPAHDRQAAYIHLDHRPGEADMSWTYEHGTNRYHPAWARRARTDATPTTRRGAGV
ncbi:MAG: DUF882 domain-containing protein [Kofleriaceae bacterium]